MLQLLNLLKTGCSITFPSGYIIKGDPSTNYIDTGFDLGNGYQADGVRLLDIHGLNEALKDEKFFKHKTSSYQQQKL